MRDKGVATRPGTIDTREPHSRGSFCFGGELLLCSADFTYRVVGEVCYPDAGAIVDDAGWFLTDGERAPGMAIVGTQHGYGAVVPASDPDVRAIEGDAKGRESDPEGSLHPAIVRHQGGHGFVVEVCNPYFCPVKSQTQGRISCVHLAEPHPVAGAQLGHTTVSIDADPDILAIEENIFCAIVELITTKTRVEKKRPVLQDQSFVLTLAQSEGEACNLALERCKPPSRERR